MSGVPKQPPRPIYSSSTATSVTLTIQFTEDNNGAQITKHELYRDIGDYGSDVTTLTAYDGTSATYTVSGLSQGKVYNFAVLAKNARGSSLLSYNLAVATATLPAAPATLTKVSSCSS